LRRLGFDDAGEDFVGEEQNFDASRDDFRHLAALADEYSFEHHTAAEGFGEEVVAFYCDHAAAEPCVACEGCAELLDAAVGSTGDDGLGGVGSGQRHLGNLTLMAVLLSLSWSARLESAGALYYGAACEICMSASSTPAQEPDLTAEILRIHPDEPEPDLISHVVNSLNSGNVVALPTDTFYGLAVDPVNLRAVERIYEIKTRAQHKPLSLLISEVAQAYEMARSLDTAFDRLAEKFWPGPLTIVVKAGSKLPLRVTANTGNLALRVPEAAIPRAVVEKLGLPITATSANLSGLPECTYANGVRDQLGDGGNSWMILREGAIPTHEIALTLQR
jgi:L-threonylcarbamoyladenylate synthase